MNLKVFGTGIAVAALVGVLSAEGAMAQEKVKCTDTVSPITGECMVFIHNNPDITGTPLTVHHDINNDGVVDRTTHYFDNHEIHCKAETRQNPYCRYDKNTTGTNNATQTQQRAHTLQIVTDRIPALEEGTPMPNPEVQ